MINERSFPLNIEIIRCSFIGKAGSPERSQQFPEISRLDLRDYHTS